MGIYLGNDSIGIPEGSVISYAGTVEPAGWLFCDGRVCDRSAYPQLFAAIGTTYNIGTETGAQFRLPDLQGRFIRGYDKTGTRDLDRNSLTNKGFGTVQEDAIRNFTGEFRVDNTSVAGLDGLLFRENWQGEFFPDLAGHENSAGQRQVMFDPSQKVPVGSDNRPKNIALNYIIKY
jgi:hypothetical protein